MNRETAFLFFALLLMGIGWGSTQSLAKIAVSEGYRHLGLVFWQLAIGAVLMSAVMAPRRQRLRTDPAALRVYLIIALIGTVLPNSASYEAARFLPAGLISILLSLVPMFAFPMALALGNERFAWGRLAGLCLGLTGVLLIVMPEASLPERAMVVFIPLALIAPMFYAFEGNVVARWGTAGLSPIEVLCGASILGALIAGPAAVAADAFIDPRPPWGLPDLALVAGSLVHVVVYTAYVWMVGRAGAIFAVQVSYLVTGAGVIWAMILLGESYSIWVWAAMAVILLGVFLVQPRPRPPLAETGESGQSSPV